MYDIRCSEFAKIGAASLIAIIFYSSFAEFIFSSLMVNVVVWFFWGAIISHVQENKNVH